MHFSRTYLFHAHITMSVSVHDMCFSCGHGVMLVGSGPTKAHRLHLKHVIRQFRAVEKRLASMLLKYTPAFLTLLAEMRDLMSITSEIIPCYSLLLEGPDGKQFPMAMVRKPLERPSCTT
jgi:hypothetical protein